MRQMRDQLKLKCNSYIIIKKKKENFATNQQKTERILQPWDCMLGYKNSITPTLFVFFNHITSCKGNKATKAQWVTECERLRKKKHY